MNQVVVRLGLCCDATGHAISQTQVLARRTERKHER